jgi:AcrR family transcriptional regulator
MIRKAATIPRKHAAQARSRATVEALVEATARILVRDGFDRASTNRIAEEAGVSVGSLYQYFPGKDALVAAVIARHQRELMAIARHALAEIADQPLDAGVRRLVAAAVAAHRADPELHHVLSEQTPRTGALAGVEAFNRGYHDLFKAYLEHHGDELRPIDLDLAAFVCVTSIEAITHTAVLHRPQFLTDAAAEALADEAVRLILGYLRP